MSEPPTRPDARTAAAPAPEGASAAPATRDRVLLVVFWVWAGLLLAATVAQFLGPAGEGLLDALDAKRWFAR